jgi:hypothetical protein
MSRSRRATSTGREPSTPGRQSTLDTVSSPPIGSPSPPNTRRASDYFTTIGMTSAAIRGNEDLGTLPGAIPIPSRGPPRLTSRHGSSAALSASPNIRDHVSFNPATDGRPASVASSSSSHPGKGFAVPKAKAAPAMAVTISHGGGGVDDESIPRRTVRKTASTASLSQAIPNKEHASGTQATNSTSPTSTAFATSFMGAFRSRASSSNSKRPTSILSGSLGNDGSQKGSAADLLKRLESKNAA